MKYHCHSSYLTHVLHPAFIPHIVKMLSGMIKHHVGLNNFKAIAFTGMSGALIAPLVAQKLKKPLLLVRKKNEGEYSHSGERLEGFKDADSYIIIDDKISCGRTIAHIIDSKPCGECKGIFLYRYHSGTFVYSTMSDGSNKDWDTYKGNFVINRQIIPLFTFAFQSDFPKVKRLFLNGDIVNYPVPLYCDFDKRERAAKKLLTSNPVFDKV